MKGEAPKKVEPGKSVMGIDEGTSTVAAVSGDAVFLEELAPQCVGYNKEITKLQRQIDVSTRKTNPDKFNEDGTCRKRSGRKNTGRFPKTVSGKRRSCGNCTAENRHMPNAGMKTC